MKLNPGIYKSETEQLLHSSNGSSKNIRQDCSPIDGPSGHDDRARRRISSRRAEDYSRRAG